MLWQFPIIWRATCLVDSACGVAEACQAYRVLSGRRCGRQGTVLTQQGGGAWPVQMNGPLLRGGFRCFPRRRAPATSGRLSAGVVRRRARRPREMPAYGGVSGWFGLRNRPEFAVHRRSSREAVGRAAAARRVGYIDGFLTGAHEVSPRSCSVLMTRWMLELYGRFLAMVSGGVLLTSIWVGILVIKVRRNGGLTEILKGDVAGPGFLQLFR